MVTPPVHPALRPGPLQSLPVEDLAAGNLDLLQLELCQSVRGTLSKGAVQLLHSHLGGVSACLIEVKGTETEETKLLCVSGQLKL